MDRWQDLAACAVDNPDDLSMLFEPDEVTGRRWAKKCASCNVLSECFDWAVVNASGVFCAGEWWE